MKTWAWWYAKLLTMICGVPKNPDPEWVEMLRQSNWRPFIIERTTR